MTDDDYRVSVTVSVYPGDAGSIAFLALLLTAHSTGEDISSWSEEVPGLFHYWFDIVTDIFPGDVSLELLEGVAGRLQRKIELNTPPEGPTP